MPNILIGVTGGIAAYKALELVRLADGAGHRMRVVQTPSSLRFVGRASFAALSGAPVLVGEHDPDHTGGAFPGEPAPQHEPISHLRLAERADLFVIAPASANTIAKLAHGLADNLLTSAALACECPLVVAPAMNNRMYEHPATQANIELLRARGVRIAEPGSGRLASRGEHGIGRLAEPADLLAICESILAGREGRRRPAADGGRPPGAGTLAGQHVLITAGGTREAIDSVRYIGNRSSGRMGLALARAALARGAHVTVVGANISLPCPPAATCVPVESARELRDACESLLPEAQLLLMAAAVADFAPAEPAAGKLKKEGRERLTLDLARTPDILSGLAAKRAPGQVLVGFAAEHGEGAIEEARRKLAAKGLDAVVLNDVAIAGIGFDAAENEVRVLSAHGEHHLPRAPKPAIAEGILDLIEPLLGEARAATAAAAGDGDGRSAGAPAVAAPAGRSA